MTRPEQVIAQFETEGVSIKEWAERRGYSLRTVYAVLRGDLRCKRGVSHRIAVDLGLKDEPQDRRFS